MERSEKLERGRGCPATKSRGGAGGASVEGSLEGKPATPGHQYILSTPQGCSLSKESRNGRLTGDGDDEKRSRPQMGNFQIEPPPVGTSQMECELVTTGVRGRGRSNRERGGATGALGSPRSFAGNNGGEGLRWIRELYECSGCVLEHKGAERKLRGEVEGLSSRSARRATGASLGCPTLPWELREGREQVERRLPGRRHDAH